MQTNVRSVLSAEFQSLLDCIPWDTFNQGIESRVEAFLKNLSASHKPRSTTIVVMFYARSFSLNFAAPALVAAFARVNTIKTTTIKG